MSNNAYVMDTTGRPVAQPLPEINDRHGLEIPAEPSLAAQVEQLSARLAAQDIAIGELAEGLTALARECHELAKTTGKLHSYETAAELNATLLRGLNHGNG